MSSDVHGLAGPYAVDALDEVERALFERHLASCPVCRAEVDEFHETTSRLGAAVAERPPAGMRDSVLAAVDVTRQRSPLAASRGPSVTRHLRRVLAPVAAAAVAVVVTLAAGQGVDRPAEPDRTDEVAEMLAAPDARTVPLQTTGEFEGRVVTAPSADHVLVSLSGLEQREGEVYVVWTFRDGGPVREDEVSAEADGEATMVMLDGAAEVTAVALTREPPGGGAAPAGPVVAEAALE